MDTGKRIRVLIADDSAFMRKVLQSILAADAGLEVAGEARDGREAVSLAESLRPDVITMDINMPHMDGIQAVEHIMSSNPRPILMVSSEARDGAEPTLRALQLGAIDFVSKPTSGIDLDMESVRSELVRKIRMAAKVRVVRTAVRTRPVTAEIPSNGNGNGNGSGHASVPRPAVFSPQENRSGERAPLVVIAASTGGPATLSRIVPLIPREFPAPILIVQHMPGAFTSQFTAQLAAGASVRVKEAENGEALQSGMMYVCPGSGHVRVSATGRLSVEEGPRVNGYRPCADIALESAAAYAGRTAIGVILTGMGNDGTRGAQAIKAAGGHVIVQDEATSVIFGMPAEAIKAGAADQILPLDNIVSAIEKRCLYVFGAARVGAL